MLGNEVYLNFGYAIRRCTRRIHRSFKSNNKDEERFVSGERREGISIGGGKRISRMSGGKGKKGEMTRYKKVKETVID